MKTLIALLLGLNMLVSTSLAAEHKIRVPAEWEPQGAIWMQWPGHGEVTLRPAFAEIISVITQYQPVHLLAATSSDLKIAKEFLSEYKIHKQQVIWHTVLVDNSWMRDNGPIYVTNDQDVWIQNWKFDAWGGNFGRDIPYENDDTIPTYVADQLDITSEDYQDYVLEKGNLESNGSGVIMLNWDCQNLRNPRMSQNEHEAILKDALGAEKILWAYGYDPEDLTTGHIDGIARFINQNTIVISNWGEKTAVDLEVDAKKAGLNVQWYPGDVNWLVGNGFVLAMADEDPEKTKELEALLQSYYPERKIHLIKAFSIAKLGGGIHCVTNDQPVLP